MVAPEQLSEALAQDPGLQQPPYQQHTEQGDRRAPAHGDKTLIACSEGVDGPAHLVEQFAQLQQVNAVDLDARQRAIGELVTPLRETLDKVDVKLQDVEKQRIGAYEMLMEQVRAMVEAVALP